MIGWGNDMAKISKIDWDIIDARVRSLGDARELPNLSMAMLWLVLDQFFRICGLKCGLSSQLECDFQTQCGLSARS